jgi:hypothetical protein
MVTAAVKPGDNPVTALELQALRCWDGLVDALAERRRQLGLTQLDLDDRAGFQSGYTGKLEAWLGRSGRVAGTVTLPLWLEALGVVLVVVDAPASASIRRLLEEAGRPKVSGKTLRERPRLLPRRQRLAENPGGPGGGRAAARHR